jgi:hypothetical protein
MRALRGFFLASWFAATCLAQGVDIYNAKATDFVKATERVYRGTVAASGLRVEVRP